MHWKFSSYPPLGWIELSIVLKHSSFHTKVNPWWGWVVDSAIQFWRKLWFKHKELCCRLQSIHIIVASKGETYERRERRKEEKSSWDPKLLFVLLLLDSHAVTGQTAMEIYGNEKREQLERNLSTKLLHHNLFLPVRAQSRPLELLTLSGFTSFNLVHLTWTWLLLWNCRTSKLPFCIYYMFCFFLFVSPCLESW